MPNTSEPVGVGTEVPPPDIGRWWRELRHAMRRWRRGMKARLPYVRRREFAKLACRYSALADAAGLGVKRAEEARIDIRKSVDAPLDGEICLFLCHHRGPGLAPHVRDHLEQLLDNGVQVILILNAYDLAADVELDTALAGRLRGLFVRENIGFDFAGWAHVHALVKPWLNAASLWLVNDSIVGPVNVAHFGAMITRIRASSADMLGLTEALTPLPHLQSFFLVFQRRLAASAELSRFFASVLCFADKGTVIDVYETRLTQRMRDAGYRCEALFPAMSKNPHASNDTFFRWTELLDQGFPYVKASVRQEFSGHPRIRGVAS